MRRRPVLLFAPIVSLAVLPIATMRADESAAWRIDAAASEVQIRVGTAGIFGFLGHEHEIEATGVEGSVRWVPDAPDQSSVEIVFDAASLRVLDPELKPDKRRQVQSDMELQVLEIRSYPTIRFASRRVRFEADGSMSRLEGTVVGDLTLHGTTRGIEIPITLTVGESELRAAGAARFRGSDFGIDPVRAGAGTVKTKDELELRFEIVARR